MIDRPSGQLTDFSSFLAFFPMSDSSNFYRAPFCPYLSLTFSLTVSLVAQSSGRLMGSQRRLTERMTEWWYRHQRLITAQRGPFHSMTPQIRGQINSVRRNVCVSPRVGMKSTLGSNDLLVLNLIWAAQCGFWSPNQMCTCAVSLSLSLLNAFHTPAFLLCTIFLCIRIE